LFHFKDEFGNIGIKKRASNDAFETKHIQLNNQIANLEKLRNFSNSETTTPPVIRAEKYLFKIDSERINRLFRILKEKENKYGQVLTNLNLISFSDLVSLDKNKNFSSNNSQTFFNVEIGKYLHVENNNVEVTNEFIAYLNAKSDQHSFTKPRNQIKKAKITEVNCV